jgi:hypothetical protein
LDLATPADGGKIIKETPLEEFFVTCAVRWPTYASYWNEMFDPCASNLSDHNFSNDQRWLLQTQAQTAVLRLSSHSEHKFYTSSFCYHARGFSIFSLSGKVIGVAHWSPFLDDFVGSKAADGMTERELDNPLVVPSLKAMALSIGMTDHDVDCFVAEKDIPNGCTTELEVYEYATYQDSTGRWWDPVPVVNVMFIGERDGHWYRMGVGIVLLRRWVEMERKVETITLC